MGSTHATTGGLTGIFFAGLIGGDLKTVAAGAVLGAGAALVSDLDHGNSCATLAHGPFTKISSKVIVWGSRLSYTSTRTGWEKGHPPSHDPGGHRYLTHTGIFALAAGIITFAVSVFWPVRMVIEFFLISFAIRGITQALPGSNKIDKWPVRSIVSIIGAWLLTISPLTLAGIMTVGILTHIGADAMTKAGVPLCWPIKIRGQRWCRLRAPMTITTGKGRVEPFISWASFVVGAIAGLYLV